jgi:hypothetical protein
MFWGERWRHHHGWRCVELRNRRTVASSSASLLNVLSNVGHLRASGRGRARFRAQGLVNDEVINQMLPRAVMAWPERTALVDLIDPTDTVSYGRELRYSELLTDVA